MSFDDWLLALHVLSAFALVAGMVVFWALIVYGRRADTPEATLRIGPGAKLANAVVGIGAGGTIVLGVALAFSVGGYNIWDGWIVAAIVLWVAAMALGGRTSAEYGKAVKRAEELQAADAHGPSAELAALNRTSRGLALQALSSVAILLILIDMIWKPGA